MRYFKKLINVSIFILIFAGCTQNRISHSLKEINISNSDSLEFYNRLEKGKWLARNDFCVMVATDSLLEKKNVLEKYNGYYFYYNDEECEKVIFGNCNESNFQNLFEVKFVSDSSIVCYKFDSPKTIDSKFLNWTKIVKHSKELNRTHMQKLDCTFNYYIEEEGNTIICYWIPTSTDEYLAFCGGLKTIYDKISLEMIDNILLHKSVIKYPRSAPDKWNLYGMFIAVLDSLPNEVDFAHFFINEDLLKRQDIITTKYHTALSVDNPERNLEVTFYELQDNKNPSSNSTLYADYMIFFNINLNKKDEFESASLVVIFDVHTREEVQFQLSEKFMQSANKIFRNKKWRPSDFTSGNMTFLFMSEDCPDIAFEKK